MNKEQLMDFFSRYANSAPWSSCESIMDVFDEREELLDAMFILSTQLFDDHGNPLEGKEIPDDHPSVKWALRKLGLAHAGVACSPFGKGLEGTLEYLDKKYPEK